MAKNYLFVVLLDHSSTFSCTRNIRSIYFVHATLNKSTEIVKIGDIFNSKSKGSVRKDIQNKFLTLKSLRVRKVMKSRMCAEIFIRLVYILFDIQLVIICKRNTTVRLQLLWNSSVLHVFWLVDICAFIALWSTKMRFFVFFLFS